MRRHSGGFDRVNLVDGIDLEQTVAHGGQGSIHFCRVADATALSGALNFIDLAVVPPGASIGVHQHGDDEEEFYLVLDGVGRMWRDGAEFAVRAGDLVRNQPGGVHGLVNTGTEDLRIFVFELKAGRQP
jgi:mannose-6-phosphate isomerase-like protein (cupin superfamily)